VEETFRSGLLTRTRAILEQIPDAEDHLRAFPWLTGALGEPESAVWFVGENPRLTMVERVSDPSGGPPTEEAQMVGEQGRSALPGSSVQIRLQGNAPA
jgi:hypothetical protein